MMRLRLAVLPHVFVSGHRPPAPPTAYVTARDLRAAIAANAALMTFAGDDDAMRAPGGHDPFAAPATPAAASPDQASPTAAAGRDVAA
jgi:hypothetical protein